MIVERDAARWGQRRVVLVEVLLLDLPEGQAEPRELTLELRARLSAQFDRYMASREMTDPIDLLTAELDGLIARLRELEAHYFDLSEADVIGSDSTSGYGNGFSYSADALELLVAGEPWRSALAGLTDG